MAESGDRAAENGDEGKGRSKKKRLLWVLLALVAVILLVVLLMSLLGGEEKKPVPAPGTLTADGHPIVPIPPSGLGSLAGQHAEGTAVDVQSVNGNEGFFVGPNVADRVYVEWGGDVGADEPSTFQPKVGEKVNLAGTVQEASGRELKRLGLPVDGEELVGQQGGFINAEEVTAAK